MFVRKIGNARYSPEMVERNLEAPSRVKLRGQIDICEELQADTNPLRGSRSKIRIQTWDAHDATFELPVFTKLPSGEIATMELFTILEIQQFPG
jgi:hypothetical protein